MGWYLVLSKSRGQYPQLKSTGTNGWVRRTLREGGAIRTLVSEINCLIDFVTVGGGSFLVSAFGSAARGRRWVLGLRGMYLIDPPLRCSLTFFVFLSHCFVAVIVLWWTGLVWLSTEILLFLMNKNQYFEKMTKGRTYCRMWRLSVFLDLEEHFVFQLYVSGLGLKLA